MTTRRQLSHDVDAMSQSTALVVNLRNGACCKTGYGGTEPTKIAERFSPVDPKLPVESMNSWKRESLSVRIPRKFEGMSDLSQRLARFRSFAAIEIFCMDRGARTMRGRRNLPKEEA